MSTNGQVGCQGLKTTGNQLAFPPGSYSRADNCVIPSKDVLMPRRGQDLENFIDGDSDDANSNRAKELAQWGDHLLVNYTGDAGYFLVLLRDWLVDGTRISLGAHTPPEPTLLRMKFAELASSLYWTTAVGLYTLDATTGTARAAGLQRPAIYVSDADGGTMTRLAGAPDAAASWLFPDKAVAYRACVGRKDANGVIKLSAASGRVVVVNGQDVVAASGAVVRSANVVTVTVDSHNFRVGDLLALSVSDSGAFDTSPTAITATTDVSFTYSETGAGHTSGVAITFSSGVKFVQVLVGLPTGTHAGDFVQLYRTDESAGAAIDPGDECFLAYERIVSAADLISGVTIQDTTPSTFLGAPLDSNANTGDGELGVNTMPPLARDICEWDGRLWAAQTVDRHRLTIRLLGTEPVSGLGAGLQSGDRLAVNGRVLLAGTNFAVFTQYTPSKNVEMTIGEFATFAGSSTAGGISSHLEHDGDTGLGEALLEQNDLASTLADGSSGAISAIYAATSRQSAFADALALLKAITEANTSRTGSTVTVRCVGHGFSAGQVVMLARDVTGTTDANFPVGLKTVTTVTDADNFKYTEAGAAATMSGGTPYFAYAATFKSDNFPQPLRCSRAGEPEGWPLANTFNGKLPDRAEVLRIRPSGSGDSLMVCLKRGGTYQLSGQYPYVVRRIDRTTLVAPDSLQEHGGKLYGLTTQGLCVISEAGVGTLPQDVDDDTRAAMRLVVDSSLDLSSVFGVSYETDKQYQCWLPDSTNGVAANGYVYHSLLGQYTRWPIDRRCGLVFEGADLLIMGDGSSNRLRVERKLFGADLWECFADEQLDIFGGYAPNGDGTTRYTVDPSIDITGIQPGAAIQVPASSGNYYRVIAVGVGTIDFDGDLAPDSEDGIVYASYEVSAALHPDARGHAGIESQFRELQLHFGAYLADVLTLNFSNEQGATGNLLISNSGFDFGVTQEGVSTRRAEVPEAVQHSAMLTVELQLNEAFSFFRLLGVSKTGEDVSERTGE